MTRPKSFKYGVLGVAGILLTALGYHGAGWIEALGSTGPDRPVVHLERTEWDFGTVSPGDTRSASFAIVNRGRQRLILRKLNGSCDCLSARDAELIVEPFGRGCIELEFTPENLDGPARLEQRYATNDPALPKFSLICTAVVQAGP